MRVSLFIIFSILISSSLLTFSESQVIPSPQSDYVNYTMNALTQVFGGQYNNQQIEYNNGYLYSGYLNISATRQLKYWFTTKVNSTIDSTTKMPSNHGDLIVWLNGGPGCSSLEGALSEIGPFIVGGLEDQYTEQKISINDQSYNRFANLLFIETPAGVGFSLLNDTMPQNDLTVGQDNLNALLLFLEGYGFQNKNVWISGESYAGVYVPHFVHAIHEYNINQTLLKLPIVQLQGWMVGNPLTSNSWFTGPYQGAYQVPHIETFLKFDLLNQSMADQYYASCLQNSTACTQINNTIANLTATNYNNQYTPPWLNYYDLKRSCLQYTWTPAPSSDKKQKFTSFQALKNVEQFYRTGTPVPPHINDTQGQCTDDSGLDYFFNNKTFWNTLHIVQNPQTFDWADCWVNISNVFTPSPNASEWIYELLLPLNKYKVLVYSGETDFAVPTAATVTWIQQMLQILQLNIIVDTKVWFSPDSHEPGQLYKNQAGTISSYENSFNFATVFGVGHMVPQWARKQAYTMVYNFINNQPLPSYNQQFQQF